MPQPIAAITRPEFVGTEAAPRVVKQSEITPVMRHALFRWALLEDLDLNVDLRDADFLDSRVIRCDARGAKFDDLISLRTEWPDTEFPRSMGGYLLASCHDVADELLRRDIIRAKAAGDIEQAKVEEVVQRYIMSSYFTSYRDTVTAVVKAGFTIKQFQEVAARTPWLQEYRIFGSDLAYALTHEEAGSAVRQEAAATEIILNGLDTKLPVTDIVDKVSDDRFLAAHETALYLNSRFPEQAPWHVHYSRTFPVVDAQVHSQDDLGPEQLTKPDWWRGQP